MKRKRQIRSVLAAVVCPLGKACLPLYMSAVAVAAPTSYGEDFLRLGQGVPQAVVPLSGSSPGDVSDLGDAVQYQRQLAALEHRGGPYTAALAEPLAGLARLQEQQGDIAGARQLYERALHLVRVNDGLYSERQVPILRRLFASYRQAGDMQTLDSRYEYYFRLYGAGQPPYTPLRLRAALEYLRWQREALLLKLDGKDPGRLLALYDLNEELLEAVAADPDAEYPLYRKLLLSQMHNLYLVQDRFRPELQSHNEPPLTMTADGWDQQNSSEYHLETLQRKALSSGRQLLEELIARTPPDQPVELAANYLELGDWNQWNDRGSEADSAYRQAYNALRDAGEGDLLQQWLGTPQELPANGVFQLPVSTEVTPAAIVKATFDVSVRGRADDIEAIAVDAAAEGRVSSFRRALARTRFRPGYQDGEPREFARLTRDYQLLQ